MVVKSMYTLVTGSAMLAVHWNLLNHQSESVQLEPVFLPLRTSSMSISSTTQHFSSFWWIYYINIPHETTPSLSLDMTMPTSAWQMLQYSNGSGSKSSVPSFLEQHDFWRGAWPPSSNGLQKQLFQAVCCEFLSLESRMALILVSGSFNACCGGWCSPCLLFANTSE